MKVEDKERAEKPDAKASRELVFTLNHELRRRILRLLLRLPQDSSASPVEISEALGRPLSNVSYHFRVLIDKGAVFLTETRQVRGSIEHFYRPTAMVTNNKLVPVLLRDIADDDSAT